MAKSSGKSTKKSESTKESGDTKKASTKAGKKVEKDTSTKVGESKTTSTMKKSTTKKATPPKTSNKEKEIKEEEIKEKSDNKKSSPKKAKKEPALKCKFCQKTMNNQKTLKIHERNCQTKKDQEIEKKLNASMLKMKDDFEDEQQSIVKQFQKREDALQNELDEMRTVLRMELDKHRKELEMIRKVEKQVAEVAERQSEPIHEPIHTPDGQPRAIDMIPTPLPNIPKKIIEPVPIEEDTEPKEEPLPVIRPEEEHPEPAAMTPNSEPKTVVESVPEESSAPESIQKPVPAVTGLYKEEIEELVKSLVKESASDLPSSAGDMPDLEEFKTKMRQISGRLDSLDTKIDRFNNDMRKSFERIEKDSNLWKIQKELDKVSDKIIDMMEDIGFSEDLSVTKIPPTILEIVYQATLDDIHFEIVRTKGAQDAETIARTALEEVRLKTSGSELFKFDGRKIVTDNLARSISANLISAKQIQTTYDVLLDRLLETVPHHKAKNFRGMIKVKSQEFAVDRATVLTKEYDRLEKIIESTSQMVAAISAQSNAKNLEVQETLEDIKNNLLAEKASKEDIELMRIKMQEQDEKDAQLDNELALLKAEIEMKEQIKAKEDTEDLAIIVPGEVIDAEEIIKDTAEIEEPKPDISPAVLESIQKGASSKTAIIRDTSMEEDDVLAAIAGLVKDKKIIEKKIGKRIKYLTPEQELDEKLEKDKEKDMLDKKPKKVTSSKKKEEKEEPQKEEKPSTKASKKKDKPSPKKESKEPVKEKVTAKKEEPKPKKEAKPEKKAKKPEPKKEEPKPKKEVKPEKETRKPEPKKEEPKPKKEAKPEKATKTPDPKKEAPNSKKEAKPEKEAKRPEKEVKPKEEHVDDALPVITKKLEDLSGDERQVLNVISKEGMTISGIQSKVGKSLKRFALLRALRVLIDSGYVGIITKGRMDLYQKINVTKMDKKKQNKTEMEVK